METAGGPVQQVLKVIVSNRLMITSLYLPSEHLIRASLVAQMVKNLPAMQETQVQFLGWEDPLEKVNDNPLQYSCLENPMDRGAWRAQSMGSQESNTT